MGQVCGFHVGVVEAVQVNGIIVSSSMIRDMISSGRVEEAAKLLDRFYSIEGEVVHGSRRGHTLGFPTANVRTANELLPPFGVYAVIAAIDNRLHKGVASIGVRPTFDAGPVSIEVYLFDFQGELYGKQIEVSFVQRLRGEEKFPDADALVKQIQQDVKNAERVLKNV
jgi:riboflavin kinase/FMN adenylyltransferase